MLDSGLRFEDLGNPSGHDCARQAGLQEDVRGGFG